MDINNTFSKLSGEGTLVINLGVPSSSTKTTPTIPSPNILNKVSSSSTLVYLRHQPRQPQQYLLQTFWRRNPRRQPQHTFIINQDNPNNTLSKYFGEDTRIINLGIPSSSNKTTPTIPSSNILEKVPPSSTLAYLRHQPRKSQQYPLQILWRSYPRHQPQCTFVINQDNPNNTLSKYFREGTFVINLDVPSSSTKTTPTIPSPNILEKSPSSSTSAYLRHQPRRLQHQRTFSNIMEKVPSLSTPVTSTSLL